METPRVTTSFRLHVDLVETLKAMAMKKNCSLSRYVEQLLLEHTRHIPNEETIATVVEAKQGIAADLDDASSIETFLNSIFPE